LKVWTNKNKFRILSNDYQIHQSGTLPISINQVVMLYSKHQFLIWRIMHWRLVKKLWNRKTVACPNCRGDNVELISQVEIEADYLGTDVDDFFIVGYGIDFNENHRALPEIYYMSSDDHKKE
jgi:hypothetical protein